MSGRGRGRGRGRGGQKRKEGGGSTTGSLARDMLKPSAAEAGLLGSCSGKPAAGNTGGFYANLNNMMQQSVNGGPLYGPFLWHSSGQKRQAPTEEQPEDGAATSGDASGVAGNPSAAAAAAGTVPDAAPSSTAAAAADATGINTKKDDPVPIAVTKRNASMTFLVSRQRELMERFQASSHYVRIHPQIDVARYSSSNSSNKTTRPPDVAIRQESMSKKLANDERYIPVEILYPSAASLAMSRSNRMDEKRRRKKQELDELEQQELGGGGSGPGDGADEEEVGADDNDEEALEPTPEEQEEGEDYTTNYYDTDDESAGGGDEATF